MKVFDFTDGKKGRELASIKLMNSKAGWLVPKGDKVYRVELSNAPEGWEWTSSATNLQWVDKKPVDAPIKPEDFGVEAICFCWGQTQHDKIWNWVVIGTCEWNKSAYKSGVLKATFSHNMPNEQ